MKRQVKLFTLLTKPLVLFVLLFALGVGQMWAGTKRIYFDYSDLQWWDDNTKVLDENNNGYVGCHAWNNSANSDYQMHLVDGENYVVYCDIDDSYTSFLIFRGTQLTPSQGVWDETDKWATISTNNRFKVRNYKGTVGEANGKWLWAESGAGTRWAPSACIDGLLNPKNPHLQAFNGSGIYTATLAAHTTYEFKILDGTTMYGLDNNIWTSSVSEYSLISGQYQVRLCTSVAGTYTFTWDGTNHKLSVAYPEVDHPSIDYCYVIKYDSWGEHHNIHLWNGSSTLVAEWNAGSTIAGTISPGTELYNTFEYSSANYFYISPANFANFLVSKNGDGTDRSGDLTSSEGYGKRRYYNGSSWIWDTFTVRIQLENNGANVGEKGTEYVDVAFNSEALDDDIVVPVKDGYTFGGYYTGDGGTGTQLISDAGKWTTSAVADYLDASHHWIHAGMSTTLYAKWTEDKHTVSVAVSPAGAGSVQVNSSNVSSVTGVGIATKSDEMTPIALAGWKFKEWQVTSNVQMDLVNYHSDYQQGTANKMKINATADDQTITAVFEPRYYLVGKIWDDSADGGMPGWDNYNKPFKVVTTSPVLDTCKVTLETNKSFYIEVRDKTDGYSYGKSGGTLNDNTTLTFTDKDNKVFVHSNGGTEYTFKITGIDGNGRPTVSVERPYQVNVGRKRVDIDGSDHDDNTGGTVAMSKTEGGDAVSNGAWVPYGTSVKYDASAESGYSLAWFTGSDYSSQFSTDATFYHIATSTGNGYAKFTEKATTVTLANDGHGKVQISSTDKTSTTCGVTTTRSLTAVPNDGYMFSSWTKTSGSDYDLSTTSVATTTLTGLGGGESSGQTVTANFALRWALKAESLGWGSASFDIDNISTIGGDAVGYVDISLAANTNYDFTITDKQESATYKNGSDKVYYMTNGNSYVWDFSTSKSHNCGITTAGAGTYRFMWNITDKTMSVIYPNFVIYRAGDKDEDAESATHTISSPVESYSGGTINQGIEYRMKVHELDKWYTLCLPFTVSAVKVWETDRYYDLVPFYRSAPGATYYSGDYIIRTPQGERVESNPGIEIELDKFGDWRDPESPTGYLPSANTPYIVQWHHSYFAEGGGRYISFFGATGQTIPTSMTAVGVPSENAKVRVCGNDAMKEGKVAGAYLLDNDYGSGAWLRDEKIDEERTILPFECYVRASSEITGRYLVIRRGMTLDDQPTGWDDVLNSERKAQISVYTISGFLVTQFSDCSFDEAARRLQSEYNEGLLILRSENESVKLMLGGK